jgi:hypothetical protein
MPFMIWFHCELWHGVAYPPGTWRVLLAHVIIHIVSSLSIKIKIMHYFDADYGIMRPHNYF